MVVCCQLLGSHRPRRGLVQTTEKSYAVIQQRSEQHERKQRQQWANEEGTSAWPFHDASSCLPNAQVPDPHTHGQDNAAEGHPDKQHKEHEHGATEAQHRESDVAVGVEQLTHNIENAYEEHENASNNLDQHGQLLDVLHVLSKELLPAGFGILLTPHLEAPPCRKPVTAEIVLLQRGIQSSSKQSVPVHVGRAVGSLHEHAEGSEEPHNKVRDAHNQRCSPLDVQLVLLLAA
mmetsp:Transcript_50479/g.117200  ORF Transcript_50479/g.117200 Transcript_50479/m.117200 type:complete len:233 (+) Transcript_50479:1374-2072(+)